MSRNAGRRRDYAFGGLTRSQLMARIRSHGNATTERLMVALLRRHGALGVAPASANCGRPDFAWRRAHVAVFVDGCFWHGHDCGRNLAPRTNSEFWQAKISKNKARDRHVTLELERAGWVVLRIWECDLRKNADSCIARIKQAVHKQPLHDCGNIKGVLNRRPQG